MMNPSNKSEYQLYFQASYEGAARGLAGLCLEHPFDVVKTKMQAEPNQKIFHVAKTILQNGYGAFYRGAIPNGFRLALKQSYRWPMMVGFPKFFKKNISEDLQKKFPSSVEISTGLSIATFESFIICPLERLKVYLMTSPIKQKNLRTFFLENKENVYRELTRGVGAVYVRQMATWISFLVADEKIKNWEKKRTNTKKLSFTSLLKVGLMVGIINTAVCLPFDMLKTNLQKEKYLENEGLVKTAKKVYFMYGIKGFYAGWQIRLTQYMIQSIFTVSLLDRLKS